jgi:DNA ligase (NAD+)
MIPDLFSSAEDQEMLPLTDKLLESIDDHVAEASAAFIIRDLIKVIRYHDKKYYQEAGNVISDFDYDRLFARLKALEEDYPTHITTDSPTRRVSDALNEGFKTVAHLLPMLSLDNSYNLEDLERFDKRIRDGLPDDARIAYTVEPKFDGSSIALIYENDRFVRAATRGNGVEGDDITANARTIRSVPLQAVFSKEGIAKIELRGEAVIELSVFEQMNIERARQNEILRSEGKKLLEPFKNARNTAAGSLRLKDPAEVALRKLDVIVYQVGYAEDAKGNDITDNLRSSHAEYLRLLASLGFRTPGEAVRTFSDIKEVAAYCLEWQDLRDSYHIDIDGMVIKLDNIRQQQLLGRTSHHPKWAVAYKFKAKQATSVLRKVDYQVGRTGAVTPVAKIDPVQLVGVEISSISLHNEEFIAEKDIRIGDTVIVERAGDVIPYITGIVPERRTGQELTILFPRECPSCGHHLVKPAEESIWRCINPDCPAQIEERLIHFVSVNAMDIQGLGQEIIRTFIREGIIQTIADIYRLDYNRILALEGWKQKSVENLRSNIEASKENDMWRLITGLGIRHVGSTTAKMLASEVPLLTDFATWAKEDFTQLKDVGPKVATSLFEFFSDADNMVLIANLAALGVNIKRTEVQLASEKLSGKTFLFTGTLPTLSRDEGKALVEANGGKILSGVSANLNYLVAGEKAGSKLAKAQKIPSVEIIDEATFLQMIS